MQALCSSMSTMRVSAPKQMSKPLVAAKSLSSKTNGIMSVPKLTEMKIQQQKPVATLGLEIMCADGRRGGKLKTRKAAAKRYRITGSGNVVVRHAGKNHFQEKKSSKRRNKLSMMHLASPTHLDLIKGCLPYKNIK